MVTFLLRLAYNIMSKTYSDIKRKIITAKYKINSLSILQELETERNSIWT